VIARFSESFESGPEIVDDGKWSTRTYDKIRNKLLVLSDYGHTQGDHMFGYFKNFDKGGAGTIDPFEFGVGLGFFNLRPSTQKQATELFAMIDKNGDGEIDYQEFQCWVRGGRGLVSLQAEFEFETAKEFANLWGEYSEELAHKVSAAQSNDAQAAKARLRRRGGGGGVRAAEPA